MKLYIYSILATLIMLPLIGCKAKSTVNDLPVRPPTFDELMVLAEKKLAKNSLINSYVFSQKDGVGFEKIYSLAETGNTEAELMACYLLTSGIGVKKDDKLGYPLCKKAATKGSTSAKINLIYRDFNYDPQNMNWEETYTAFNNLMDMDPSGAHRGLQFLYGQNHPKASMPMKYHHLKQAIKHENTNAMIALSELDLRIYPIIYRNAKRAEKNLKKAYALNDFDAGYMLALEYREGSTFPKDLPKYQSMIKHMAAFLHPQSMGELAYMYKTGDGAQQDQEKAQALYMQAAKFGDQFSQKLVAKDLLFGPVDARDYKTALRFLQPQAEAGDIGAIVILAEHYERPEISDPENKHITWLSKAALLGDANAQTRLGFGMMETGFIKAMQPYIQSLEAAHKSGNSTASYLLARHYRAASGVKRDLAKAQLILSQAQSSDEPRIEEEINIIEGYISHFGGIDAVPEIIEL